MLRGFSVVLCEDPRSYQAYLIPVFCVTLAALCLSCTMNACIVGRGAGANGRSLARPGSYRRRHTRNISIINTTNTQQQRKMTTGSIGVPGTSTQQHPQQRFSTASTVEFYDTMLQSNEYVLNDPADMFCIPELSENESVGAPSPMRPQEPVCRLRNSVWSLHNSSSSRAQFHHQHRHRSDSIDTLFDATTDAGNMRKVSTMARRGSTRSGGGGEHYARPIELYFKISTCTTINNGEHSNSLISDDSGDMMSVPRIEIISPTTIGRSNSSAIGIANVGTDEAGDGGTSARSHAMQSTEDPGKTQAKDDGPDSTNKSKESYETSDFMDLKLNCSVQDQDIKVTTESETNKAITGQGHRVRSSSFGAETSVKFTRGRRERKSSMPLECLIKTKIEFNPEENNTDSEKKTNNDNDFFVEGYGEAQSKTKFESTPKKMNRTRKTSLEYPLLSNSPIGRHSLVEAWVDCHASKIDRAQRVSLSHRTPSFSQQVTIMDVVEEDQNTSGKPAPKTSTQEDQEEHVIKEQSQQQQEPLKSQQTQSTETPVKTAPKTNRRRSTKTRMRRSTHATDARPLTPHSFIHTALLLFYLVQWLPMGIYIIWSSTDNKTSPGYGLLRHLVLQYLCQLCILLGSFGAIAVQRVNKPSSREVLANLCNCNANLVHAGPDIPVNSHPAPRSAPVQELSPARQINSQITKTQNLSQGNPSTSNENPKVVQVRPVTSLDLHMEGPRIPQTETK
jgi:hypothetical protein